jgi:hypothetical protein
MQPTDEEIMAQLLGGQGLQMPTERHRSSYVQQALQQLLAPPQIPIQSFGQLAGHLGAAAIRKSSLDDAVGADLRRQAALRTESGEIARQLAGGANPANAQAAAFNASNPGELQMVQTAGQKLPDPNAAVARALQQPEVMQANPMLREMIARELAGPQTFNVPAGGALVDRKGRTVFRNPAEEKAQLTDDEREYDRAKREGSFKGTFVDWQKLGSRDSRNAVIEQYEYAKGQGYKGTLIDFMRSAKADEGGGFRAADASVFSRSAAEAYGGFYDPATGQFSGLDTETARKAAELAASAAKSWRESGGDLSHNEAFASALSQLRTPRPTNTAPPAAIEHLRKNPKLKEQFRAKYGYLPEGF